MSPDTLATFLFSKRKLLCCKMRECVCLAFFEICKMYKNTRYSLLT